MKYCSLIICGIILGLGIISCAGFTFAASQVQQEGTLPPPLVTLQNKDLSNNEIFYIGGTVVKPYGKVLIYIQGEGGSVISATEEADEKGNWFYSHPQFLDRGKYIVWAQLQNDEYVSPPSPQIELEVTPTAVQVGNWRFSYELFYGIIVLMLLSIIVVFSLLALYHKRQHRIKSHKLQKEINDLESSIKRGFALLKRDIEFELKKFIGTKSNNKEKIMEDLSFVERHIGKELYDVEKLEGIK